MIYTRVRTCLSANRPDKARALAVFIALLGSLAFGRPASAQPEMLTPERNYNEGTQLALHKKLPDAETRLQEAVSSQDSRVQEPALYNLGDVRFQQGAEDLKKGPDSQAAMEKSRRAEDSGNSALGAADAALGGADLDALVSAYMQGRGARRDLKSAMESVKRALESNAGVLTRWQRASGDFKSAYELSPADLDAKTNADLVDRNIAKLVDLQRMLQNMLAGMQKQRQQLKEKMGQMKGKMPGPPPGPQNPGGSQPDEDDDDDGDKPMQQPKAGQEEGPTQNGREMALTPDEAQRLLGMLRLDSNRKLPLGGTEQTKPKDRHGRDW